MATSRNKPSWRDMILPFEWGKIRRDDVGWSSTSCETVLGSFTVERYEHGAPWRWSWEFNERDSGHRECKTIKEGRRLAWEYYLERMAPAFEKEST